MMCSRLLRDHETHGRLYNWLERGLDALNRGYRRALEATLRVRPLVIVVALAVAGASYFLLMGLKSELAPVEDRGVLFTAGSAPERSEEHPSELQSLMRISYAVLCLKK